MGFLHRRTRVADVQEVFPLLPETGKLIFFAPHTSGHPAVLPLLSELSGMLEARGKASETHSVEDMRGEVASLSIKLIRLKIPKAERALVESLLRMKDAEIRLGIVCRLLEQESCSVLAEMHAVPRDFGLGDSIDVASGCYRLPGTRILFRKDYMSEYISAIDSGTEALRHEGSGALADAKELIGAGRTGDGMAMMLEYAGKNAFRAISFRIPAKSSEPELEIEPPTRFEMEFGFMLARFHTLSEWEIGELASALGG